MIKTTIHPKKSLGQNFLTDENIAGKIISALSLQQDDSVLEIGPGTGILTKYLVQAGVNVVAVEIDRNLIKRLQHDFSDSKNFLLHQEDFLKMPLEEILKPGNSWKVVANLPYHITSPVLFKLFENRHFFSRAILMVQKEVALRIVAPPNSKTYGILSVFSQLYAEVKKLFDVSANVFFPIPKVTSAVVKWDFKHQQLLNSEEEIIFRTVVKKVFSQRRKMLRNSLKTFEIDLNQLNLNLEQRPEQLSVADFIELTRQIIPLQTTNE